MESSDWIPQFDEFEIWVMNTEYKLFGPDGPLVDPKRTHWSRLDEMAKCLAVAPTHAAVRLFWADAVVSIDGGDLAHWTYHTGMRAPSEQQLAKFLFCNIKAAAEGDLRTRSFKEAESDWGRSQDPEDDGAGTTPGIFVWRNPPDECPEEAWPVHPTGVSATHFLTQLQRRHEKPLGIFLDYDGAELRFLTSRPVADGPDPRAAVMILGGPKGMSQAIQEQVQAVFANLSAPLVKICLGPQQEMAHACIAFMRLQDDALRFKAAVTDLQLLGKEGYAELVQKAETSLLSATTPRGKAKSSWRRVGHWLLSHCRPHGIRRRCCKMRR